jgi:uncharacterized membrane protein
MQELSKKVNADGDGVRKVVDAFERVCITSIGLVPTSDYADMSTVSALGILTFITSLLIIFFTSCVGFFDSARAERERKGNSARGSDCVHLVFVVPCPALALVVDLLLNYFYKKYKLYDLGVK